MSAKVSIKSFLSCFFGIVDDGELFRNVFPRKKELEGGGVVSNVGRGIMHGKFSFDKKITQGGLVVAQIWDEVDGIGTRERGCVDGEVWKSPWSRS